MISQCVGTCSEIAGERTQCVRLRLQTAANSQFEKCTQGTDPVNSSMNIISTVRLYNTITRSVTELNVRQQYLSDVKINDVTYQYSQKTIGIHFTISTNSQLSNTILSN